ncbi:MAG: pyridoxamine 5'-phosphate oxidase family protein [Candidatus Omnitrophica bacterium]|nr:pyridoxamine 5'-phosphate oxidase family protein [Candidatus Omnitrophota bacterium]
MTKLSNEVVEFFRRQPFTIVSSLDKRGIPHNSCKGVVKINRNGAIYLLDLYKARTFENLKRNPRISITAVNEHSFEGYCLKGKAKIITGKGIKMPVLRDWEARITNRITQRIIKNLQGEKGHSRHPEALFPKPEYLILMKVSEVIDLTPQHLRKEA